MGVHKVRPTKSNGKIKLNWGHKEERVLVQLLHIGLGNLTTNYILGKGAKKKKLKKKKLTSVSFMYVCVAENGEMLVFYSFFSQQ